MVDYELEGPKPARMYEVILPKKLGYFGKIQEVLEDLFDEKAIRHIPFVKKTISRRRKEPRCRCRASRRPGLEYAHCHSNRLPIRCMRNA